MSLVLELRVLRGVGRPLRASDGEIGAGQYWAERGREHLVGGQRVERLRLGARQRRMVRRARSCSPSLAGSTSTGSGGSSLRSTPSRPAAISPPRARYGFALESQALSSALVDASSAPRNGEATRTGASRLS